MRLREKRRRVVQFGFICLFVSLAAAVSVAFQGGAPEPEPLQRFAGPTSAQPLALSASGAVLVVANPDNNTVTLFDVANDRNQRLAEVAVGREPYGVAVLPGGARAYVANTLSGSVSVLSINKNSRQPLRVIADIPVGVEPYGLALTPNGEKLYVANSRSNSVSVISTRSNRVIRTIQDVGFEPRGLAITNDGDREDDDETVYVTQFLAVPAQGRIDGEDDSKIGLVSVIRTAEDSVATVTQLQPIKDTGFNAAGDAIGRVAAPATPVEADFKFVTGAYPNQLNSVAIKGNFAYVPSTGASPNGPVRFDVNTQSLLSAINLTSNADSGQTINMHLAVKNQSAQPKLFITHPWSIAMKHRSNEGYVISAASNIVVKLSLDAGNGTAKVENDPSQSSRVLQIPTGKNPRGIVINNTDSRAYVMNFVSRDVTVIDVNGPEKVIATLRSASLPAPGSVDDLIHAGKELYNTSIGVFDAATPFGNPVTGRMSNNGWGSCASCHPNGLTDNVVWIFASGPRRTISQHTDFDLNDPTSQRALNWSGIFEDEEDFEINIRTVSNGQGIIVAEDGLTPDNPVVAFNPTNAGRRQLKIRGFGGWDAIKAYVQLGIRAPISPIAKDDPDVVAGESIFRQAQCQSCHGGAQWTSSRVNFTPPPPASELVNGQLINQLKKVGTFDPNGKTEVRGTAAPPFGADGYVPPSLLSLSAFPRTFFHNGSADSLEAVLANVTHRSAGTNGTDMLNDAEQRRQLVKFILSIDASTPPISPQ